MISYMGTASVSEYSFKSAHTESTIGRLYFFGKSKFQSTCSELPWYHKINNVLSRCEQSIYAVTLLINNSVTQYTVSFLQEHPSVVLLLLRITWLIQKLPILSGVGYTLNDQLKTIYK